MVSITVGYSNRKLFAKASLSESLRQHFSRVTPLVRRIPKGQFLSSSDEQVFEHVFYKLKVNPIRLCEDSKHRNEPEETQLHAVPRPVPGFRMVVTIPYSGDCELWDLTPSQFRPTVPYGEIRAPVGESEIGHLDIVLEFRSNSPADDIERELTKNVEAIKAYLDAQEGDIEKHNQELERRIRRAIQHRREQLDKLEGVVKRLNIPLERRGDAPRFLPLEERRKIVPTLSSLPKETSEPWYGISNDVYTHILSVIRHEGRTFETTPCTYFVHNEEGLRDIILAHLNGHYKGAATGETFRRKGKTDIRVEEKSRSAFVAECKIWYGAQKLSGAIDQLLSYTTWRDCKAAMIVFNKHNSRFTDLLQKVPQTFAAHPDCRRELDIPGNGEWRYVFVSPGDDQQQIFIHVFAFDLHTDGACLAGARLRNADLRRADLRGSDMTGARHDEHTTWPEGIRSTKTTRS
jgi:hypothetical protein